MKILMLGVYNIEDYSRGRVLYKGLKLNNVETNIFTPKKNKYFQIIKRILKKDFDFLIVTGKIVLFYSWLLKPIHRKKIIFDVFISDYENLVIDRKIIKEKSMKSKLLKFIDKMSCKLADHCILDTQEHISYFCSEFKLKNKKFSVVYVGADDEIFYPKEDIKKDKFIVEFHGTFIPLQGVEYIVKAAKILEKENIQFKIIGSGQEHKKIKELYKDLKLNNIEFTDKNISLEELAKEINKANICLGIFGESIKTNNVIPNKAFETIATKKPLITSETKAIKEIFIDKENCLLCKPHNEKDLADKILILKNDNKLREKIANNSYKKFKDKLDNKNIGKEVTKILGSFYNSK
ncbi:glycosyltransferase [Candidatus Woesearchaeota archaeon]|nr:glycosyltransferase [Candidatus Woesearchaeota archaeon]